MTERPPRAPPPHEYVAPPMHHEHQHPHPRPYGPSSRDPFLKRLGAGVITGAADDDPSGIATYSQAGAQFGYGLSWTLFLTTPLMIAVQLVSARVAVVTGEGLAAAMRRRLPRPVLWVLVFALLVANTLNIGADLAAIGAVAKLAFGISSTATVIVVGLAIVALQSFLDYRRYARVLKWLTLSLLAYVAVLLFVHVDWRELGLGMIPRFDASRDYWLTTVAVLGTTISPYLFFWQAGQEVEELRIDPTREPILERPSLAREALKRVRLDTVVGMVLSNGVAMCIVIATAATLHARGVTDVQSAAEAAQALQPVAGHFAFALFSLGIVGAGLLAIPVLAGSAAYAVSESLGWPGELDLTPKSAPEFYGIVVAAVGVGVLLDLTPLDPMKELFYSAVVNGMVAAPIMAGMLVTASDTRLLGRFAIRGRLLWLGWAATALMAAAGAAALFAG
jgi:NRAMP (natural resistance-associated macrophage protein)-like metal ion transporter